jgi:hypothetical protein
MLIIELGMVNVFWASNSFILEHTSFWYPSLELHPPKYHSNIDVLVRKVTEKGLSTLDFISFSIYSLSTHYSCGQWSLSHTWWFCIPHRFWPIESHAIGSQWSGQAILLTPIFDWCVWLGKDQRTNTNKTERVFSEIGLCLQILWTTLYSIVNIGGPMYSVKESTNMHFR